MAYTLSKKEEESVSRFKEAVKELTGEYGNFSITFEEGGGIGIIVKIKSLLLNIEKDITDVDSW